MNQNPVPSLTEDELAIIRALRPAVAALVRAIDSDLTREEGLSHAEFVVLTVLHEAPDQELRLTDLALACHQSISAASRTVSRLEATGMVSRDRSPDDARSFNAVLTSAGLARLKESWPAQVASVRRHLFDHLEGIDLHTLAVALQRISAGPRS